MITAARLVGGAVKLSFFRFPTLVLAADRLSERFQRHDIGIEEF
jgi:hypothetical protein